MSALDNIIEQHSKAFNSTDEAARAELASLRAAVADRDTAIARAVAEEREKCAKVAEQTPLAFYDTKTRNDIAAAIRARG